MILYMGKKWSAMEREQGKEWVSPPGGHWAAERNGGVGLKIIDT